MAGPAPRDEYQGFNASPQGIAETDSPRFGRFDVKANPNDFGAQIGGALEQVGKTGEQLGNDAAQLAIHYQEQASIARGDDIIANNLVPNTAKITGNFYQTKGIQAHDAYQPTLDALNQQHADAVKDLPPIIANQVNSFWDRHLTNLQDGMQRHLNQQTDEYEKNSSTAFISAQGDIAVSAGSDPNTINQAIQSAVGKSTLFAIHNEGIDPTDPQGKAIIDERNRQITGQITQRVVEGAVLRNDLGFANNFYAQNKSNIGGAQQIEIEKSLHAENMKTFGDNASTALINGAPIPHSPDGGAYVTAVKASVAQNAQSRGADPNVALMISGLESSFGRTSSNIGQVKGSAAANQNDSINDQTTKQIEATTAANKLFNGQATPAQIYTVYQQGLAGGVALLKQENADKKAVDVISQYYATPQIALSAIVKNGGNASMTSSQFTDFLKQKCDQMYGQVKCDTPANIGTAITAPHQEAGPTVQPAATPVKALQNFDLQYPNMLTQAQAIPNIDQRNSVLASLEEKHRVYQAAANAWKTQFSGQIQDIVTKPDFTSMNDPRLTPDLRTAMADDPAMLTMARNMAKQNFDQSQGKDSDKLGSAYWDTFKKINSGEITNISQLNEQAGTGLTRDGLTQARKDLDQAGDYSTRKKASLDDIELMITRGNKESFHAQQKWNEALPVLLGAIKEREGRQIPPDQYFDKDNKEWIGNSVKNLQMTQAQSVSAKISTNKVAAQRTMGDIIADAQKFKDDPAMQAKLRQEAIDKGFYNPNVQEPPQVPLAH